MFGKVVFTIGLLLPAALLYGQVSINGGASETLIIASGELPPYVSEYPKQSFLTELFEALGQDMGVQFSFRFMPWRRCELAVDSLQAWGAIPYVRTAEREQRFIFSDPLYAKQTLLFYYGGNSVRPHSFKTLSELKPYRMGGVKGYYYELMFAEAGLKMELSSSEEQSFHMLRAGRVDLVPALEMVGWNLVRKQFPPEDAARFAVLEQPLQVGTNHLMSSRHYPGGQLLLERFNQSLAKLRGNGVYQRIADSYGLPPEN
jgi:polar amino acid transport system substrate-binding protein